MSILLRGSSRLSWSALLLLLATACGDAVVDPASSPGDARLAIYAATTAESDLLVLEVSGVGIPDPLVFNIPVEDRIASGTVTVPAGSRRLFTARLYDSAGVETHRGSKEADIREGTNTPLHLVLYSLAGDATIDVIIGSYTISITADEPVGPIGRSTRLTATVRDADGRHVPADVAWGSLHTGVATVSSTGTVERLTRGSADIVAVFAGSAAQIRIESYTATEYVEWRIGTAWLAWWHGQESHNLAASPFLSTASFQHSAWPGNFGMVDYSAIPRTAIVNNTAHAYYPFISGLWAQSYQAVAAANYGLRAMNGADLGPADRRARAFAKLIQGLGHGTIAMVYDQGPIVDENTDLTLPQQFVGYMELGAAAIGFLDEAIAIANQGFHDDVPYSWLIAETPVSGPALARYASTLRSHIRAGIARNPTDADAIDWQQVINDIDAGITEDFMLQFDGGSNSFSTLYYTLLYQWSQMNYFVHGMADQSGRYQEWMATPVHDRHPDLPGGGFLIQTPDLRFPLGTTEAAQIADGAARSGEVRFRVPGGGFPNPFATAGGQWSQPGRGMWRWSYYRDARLPIAAEIGREPLAQAVEQRLLKAEAMYRLGNHATAAQLVNVSRTAAGLNATDAIGTNTSCVPRLPDSSCGGLLEMIKWERRMTSSHNASYLMNSMYFDSRRWGDLMQGTFLQLPVPCAVAESAGMPCRNFGGGLESSAPVGTYGY
jgi:hypothetical protein